MDDRRADAGCLPRWRRPASRARFVGGCVRNARARPRDRRPRPRRRQAARDGDARARGGRDQGRADRPQARHGDGDRRWPARSSSRPCAATSRPTAAAPSSPSPTTGCEDAEPARLHLQRALRRSRRHAVRSVRWPRRSRGGPGALHRRSRHAHRRGPPARAALLPLPAPGTAGRRSTAPSYQACRAQRRRRWAACRASACARSCCARSKRRARADALDAMREAGVLDHWLPEYAGTARLRALIAREDEARRPAPAGGDPAGGRRCGGDRQAAEALDAGSAAPRGDAGARARDRHRRRPSAWRAGIYRLGNGSIRPAAAGDRRARRLARRAGDGARLDAARAAGRAAAMR